VTEGPVRGPRRSPLAPVGRQKKSYARSIRYLNGKLDEVALYNWALGAAEIQQHYQRGVTP
jgi:hypothetical protein